MRRTYAGELEWALQQANRYHRSDRDRNQAAKVAAAVRYGLDVAIARRDRAPLTPRPDIERAV